MEWLLSTPQMNSTFSSLGSQNGDTYTVNPDALAILDEINCKLTYEDQTLRTFRRAIGFGQNVRINLIPLLLNAKDPAVIDATVRILVNLTVPVECLFSVEVMYRTEAGRHTIFEINKLLLSSKEAFADAKSTKSVVDYIKFILENDKKISPEHCDAINNCLLLLRNILHIPECNSNFIPHNSQPTTMQNTILWNLFIQSIDKLMIYLMSCTKREHWSVTMVQLIAVMYKDQHISTLQKLLNSWFEASISESSEDNESNTSPPKQASGESSPMLTSSDPTSDSSDNGGGRKNECVEDRRHVQLCKETVATLQEVSRIGHQYKNAISKTTERPAKLTTSTSNDTDSVGDEIYDYVESKPEFLHPSSPTAKKSPHNGLIHLSIGKSCPQKRECQSSQSELSDCGYGTQVEHPESVSTSSNDDDEKKPIHQKPPCNQKQRSKQRPVLTAQDTKDLRRKKLVKRSKCTLISMKGLVQQIPSDEDINNILKEFTVDFLLKGYDYLVDSLHSQLLPDQKVQIDTSHFFWLVTYFLKFSTQLELDFEHVNSVLSFKIISYLTFEGITICEQLDMTALQKGADTKPYLRRCHLVITAIREFLQAVECYRNITHLTDDDRLHLDNLTRKISSSFDLRSLFVLLIRRFDPKQHTKQYLQDLITTNHMLLLILDEHCKTGDNSANFRMTQHITQFATLEIMYNYGSILEDFQENGSFVNDCVFTMMHHVGGDLDKVTTLFQPSILKTFTRIWQTDYDLSEDWADLLEYVIHKFMNTPQKSNLNVPTKSLTDISKESNIENTTCSWDQEDMNNLYWYYVQSKSAKDVIGKLDTLLAQNGNKQRSRIAIIQQLLQQDIITLVEYDDLMKFEDAEYYRSIIKTPVSVTTESGIEINDASSYNPSDDIQVLKDLIYKENKGNLLEWVQCSLLECIYAKLKINAEKDNNNDNSILTPKQKFIIEPVAYHSITRNKAMPIVPWNNDEASMGQYQPFVLLLHKMGFHLPADSGCLFARIPEFWTTDFMYDIAVKLGPLDNHLVKFEIKSVDTNCCNASESSSTKDSFVKPDDVFAMPKVNPKQMIRFTPSSTSKSSITDWFQMVARSKNNNISDVDLPPTTITATLTTNSFQTVSKGYGEDAFSLEVEEKKEDQNAVIKAGITFDNGNNERNCKLEINESEVNNCETASVASDLTRMYVSDEDDKN